MDPVTATTNQLVDFVDAADLSQALSILGSHGLDVTILAGGTDVMVQYLRGETQPRLLLHIRRLPELQGILVADRTLIGAVTTHWQLAADDRVRVHHAAIAEAAATVGGRQTQNAGTIAGNVVNASPAADLLPALLVNDATLTLAGPSSERDLSVDDFVLGRRATRRQPDELVTAISLAPSAHGAGETYLKIGRRGAMEVAIVGLAARVRFDQEGTAVDARIAVCSVGPKAFRALEAEQRIMGSKLDEDTFREAGELLRRAANPIDDGRATAAYRLSVLEPMLRRAAVVCRQRSGY